MLLVEKETREGGVEGLVKGMQRKLHLKEMVIKVWKRLLPSRDGVHRTNHIVHSQDKVKVSHQGWSRLTNLGKQERSALQKKLHLIPIEK